MLQRQPAKAAVYGVAGLLFPNNTVGGADGATVTVDVKESTGLASYSVTATAAADGSWKAMLHASPAGGDYTLTATCTSGCTGNLTAHTIRNVTFGDVWFCAGCDVDLAACPLLAPLTLAARAPVLLNRLQPKQHAARDAEHLHAQLYEAGAYTHFFSSQSFIHTRLRSPCSPGQAAM